MSELKSEDRPQAPEGRRLGVVLAATIWPLVFLGLGCLSVLVLPWWGVLLAIWFAPCVASLVALGLGLAAERWSPPPPAGADMLPEAGGVR